MIDITDGTLAWVDVCALSDLTPGRGVCALIDGQQVAIFRFPDDEVYALSNYDPFSEAYVLSRGVIGSKGDALKVASPIFKQNFNVKTGVCLDNPDVSVPAYATQVVDGRVLVSAQPVE